MPKRRSRENTRQDAFAFTDGYEVELVCPACSSIQTVSRKKLSGESFWSKSPLCMYATCANGAYLRRLTQGKETLHEVRSVIKK